ncbi:unnamed protein product [Rotaria magnacalcarata]|uniref:Uncharacterized protein n=1 Tax=Rotaria magnacalcarata TaxID=392030 RepID=A0A820TJQ1_9BILA|nr:unnamed protein product [Rotaria magnacalcarata]CAF5062985.1 unnamed protein product [Rotaria magnacalcarata]CAF5181660.1 unnamed protein product [Rotaria magnacalcarata]
MKTIGIMNSIFFETIIRVDILIVFATIINYGFSVSVPKKGDLFTVNITMNDFQTTQEDEYAYVQYKLPDEELFIVGYLPLINMNSAHHMLTYACAQPASGDKFWLVSG